jgi:amino acid transporter
MFGYLSSDILNMPRVLFRSAKDNVIPVKALAKVHPRFATPHISIIVFTALGCLFAIFGGFRQLAILSTCSVLLIYLGVALAVIKLRTSEEPSHASFKIPGGPFVPLLAITVIVWFLTNLKIKEMISMLIFICVLTIIYYFVRFFKTEPSDRSVKPTEQNE